MSYLYSKSPLKKEYTLYTQQDQFISPSNHRNLRTSPLSRPFMTNDVTINRYSPGQSRFKLPFQQNLPSTYQTNTSPLMRKSPTYFRNKYSRFENKESILMQILQPQRPKVPESISACFKNATLKEFQDFLSLQIFKHIILNNNTYKPESKNYYTSIDITKYQLTEEQQKNNDLKKSVTIMLSHYLEFVISVLDFLKKQIDEENEEKTKNGENELNTMRFGNQSLEQINNDFPPQVEEKKFSISKASNTKNHIENLPTSKKNSLDDQKNGFQFEENINSQLQEKAKLYANQIGKSQKSNPLTFNSFGLQKKANKIKEEHGEKIQEIENHDFSIIPVKNQNKKSSIDNDAKIEANDYLKLLFTQGVTRAERVLQEKLKSDKLIEINLSQGGSNLSFGDNIQNQAFLEQNSSMFDELKQLKKTMEPEFDPKMKEKINVPSDEDDI